MHVRVRNDVQISDTPRARLHTPRPPRRSHVAQMPYPPAHVPHTRQSARPPHVEQLLPPPPLASASAWPAGQRPGSARSNTAMRLSCTPSPVSSGHASSHRSAHTTWRRSSLVVVAAPPPAASSDGPDGAAALPSNMNATQAYRAAPHAEPWPSTWLRRCSSRQVPSAPRPDSVHDSGSRAGKSFADSSAYPATSGV